MGMGIDGTATITEVLSIPGKVQIHILLRHIRDHLLRYQRPEQSGFTPGKSTIDCILALQVTVACSLYRPQEGIRYFASEITLGDFEIEWTSNKDHWIIASCILAV